MNNSINTFEGISELVVSQLLEIIKEEEVYIVCDAYARFSGYVVEGREEFLQLIKERLGNYLERVVSIQKEGFIFQDLHHPDFVKPVRVERNIFYADRHIQLTNWDISSGYESAAPISCFYSFKGGLGRTTALVLTGIHLARKGKKVVLMDFDLEAPGLASLFAYEDEDINKIKGIVDYLVDFMAIKNQRNLIPLTDYYYTINRQDIVGSLGGELVLFPAGLVEGDENRYLSKLSKTNILFRGTDQHFGIDALLDHINEELKPDQILIDTRTGLNDLGGLFLSRYATAAFVFFFGSKQNMFGLETLLPKLKTNKQLKFYLVNSPVPRPPLAEEQRAYYLDKSYELFSNIYYDEQTTPFINDETAPHFPIEVPFNDLAVLLNSTEKLKALSEESNGQNPYVRMAALILPSESYRTEKSEKPIRNHQALFKAFKDIVPASASAEDEFEFDSLEKLKHNFFPRKDYKFIFDRTKYLILGEKGAGKTALFAVLSVPEYAKALARFCEANSDELETAVWIKGMDRQYPTLAVFDELIVCSDKEMRVFWKRFLIIALKGERVQNWPEFIKENSSALELGIDEELQEFNETLRKDNLIVTVIYDYLDVQISELNELRAKLIRALLEVWREIYTRFPQIRTKIFLRKDIFDREVSLTDKVKFQNHIAEIKWEYDQLLNIVWKRIWQSGAAKGTFMGEWFDGIQLTDLGPVLGFLPNANEQQNRNILGRLLGEYMGGNNKASPYNWILYHVSDTKRRMQPRSLLNLFSQTASQQLESGTHDGDTLFQPKYMELANKVVSERRLDDIKEEYPLLKPVFENLKDHLTQFPVFELQLDEALTKMKLGPTNADVKKRLEDIGVLYEYKLNRKGVEKRYHIPDLYLIGMGIKRTGPGAHKALFGKK